MLTITIPGDEGWDEVNEVFVDITEPTTIQLEHSLAAISEWEAKWKKAFLTDGTGIQKQRTQEETLDYIRCMTLTPNVDPKVYDRLSIENLKEINEYMNDKHCATYINKPPEGRRNSHEAQTAELIYYYMTQLNIPFECQYWHINRLLTFIEVCAVKQEKPKQMSKRAIYEQNHALNQARRAKLGTKG